jgi:hypothetical protein
VARRVLERVRSTSLSHAFIPRLSGRGIVCVYVYVSGA